MRGVVAPGEGPVTPPRDLRFPGSPGWTAVSAVPRGWAPLRTGLAQRHKITKTKKKTPNSTEHLGGDPLGGDADPGALRLEAGDAEGLGGVRAGEGGSAEDRGGEALDADADL